MSEEKPVILKNNIILVVQKCSTELKGEVKLYAKKYNLNQPKDKEELLELARETRENKKHLIMHDSTDIEDKLVVEKSVEPIARAILYYAIVERDEKYVGDLREAIGKQGEDGENFLEEVDNKMEEMLKTQGMTLDDLFLYEEEEENIEEALETEAAKIKILEEEKPIETRTVRVKGFNKIKKRKKSEKEQLANLMKQERELTNEEKVEIVNTLNSRGNIVDTYEYCITPFLEGIENINNNPIKDLFKNVENHEKINVRTKKEELKEFIGKIPKENLARLNCMLSIEGIKERLNEISENRDSEIKLGDFISDSVNSEVVAKTKTSGYSCNIC